MLAMRSCLVLVLRAWSTIAAITFVSVSLTSLTDADHARRSSRRLASTVSVYAYMFSIYTVKYFLFNLVFFFLLSTACTGLGPTYVYIARSMLYCSFLLTVALIGITQEIHLKQRPTILAITTSA